MTLLTKSYKTPRRIAHTIAIRRGGLNVGRLFTEYAVVFLHQSQEAQIVAQSSGVHGAVGILHPVVVVAVSCL